MRNKYIVSYDISDQKRWNSIYKLMRGYGDHVQYSVFICVLTPIEKEILISHLDGIINHNEDSIMIANIGSNLSKKSKNIETLGKELSIKERTAIII